MDTVIWDTARHDTLQTFFLGIIFVNGLRLRADRRIYHHNILGHESATVIRHQDTDILENGCVIFSFNTMGMIQKKVSSS